MEGSNRIMPVNASSFPAPSAAAIAAAVAAPSAATIAAAVAAPSSATIASAVAAAVPTISAINTAVANNAPSPVNWVFLGSGNLQNIVSATVNFSAYRKLKIVIKVSADGSRGAPSPIIRLNNDSTNGNYVFVNRAWTTGTTAIPILTRTENNRYFWGNGGGSNVGDSTYGVFEIEQANLTSTKTMTYSYIYSDGNNATRYVDGFCHYIGGSAITSVTFADLSGVQFANTTANQTGLQVWGMN
jgi:hypothetical protein